MRKKIPLLALIATVSSLSFADYTVRVPIKETLSKWNSTSPINHSWSNIGLPYNCINWTPLFSSYKNDGGFSQLGSCKQLQERQVEIREKDSFSGIVKTVNTVTENRTIETDAYRNISVESTEWQNTGSPYSCTEWLPKRDTVNNGISFTQNRNCSQDQEKQFLYKHELSLLANLTENQTINISQEQVTTGTRAVLRWVQTGIDVKVQTYYTNTCWGANETYQYPYLNGSEGQECSRQGERGYVKTTWYSSSYATSYLGTACSAYEEGWKSIAYTCQ